MPDLQAVGRRNPIELSQIEGIDIAEETRDRINIVTVEHAIAGGVIAQHPLPWKWLWVGGKIHQLPRVEDLADEEIIDAQELARVHVVTPGETPGELASMQLVNGRGRGLLG